MRGDVSRALSFATGELPVASGFLAVGLGWKTCDCNHEPRS